MMPGFYIKKNACSFAIIVTQLVLYSGKVGREKFVVKFGWFLVCQITDDFPNSSNQTLPLYIYTCSIQQYGYACE